MYADFRHRMPLRVRWAEVDKQGVVFNAHYLLYCDVCVTEYWRAVGVHYPDDFVAQGMICSCASRRSNIFPPPITTTSLRVCGRIARLGNSSMRFVVEIYRRRQYEAVLITAELIYVHTELASRTAQQIPYAMRARIRAFETTVPEDGTDANRAG